MSKMIAQSADSPGFYEPVILARAGLTRMYRGLIGDFPAKGKPPCKRASVNTLCVVLVKQFQLFDRVQLYRQFVVEIATLFCGHVFTFGNTDQ